MTSKIRAGIAGAGLMGRWHAAALKRAGGKIVAVADPNEEAARATPGRSRDVRIFSKFEEMITSADFDILHVCSPPPTHFRYAKQALEKGVHVIVEKPISSESTQAEQLLSLAAELELLLCPVHQFLFQRGTGKAMQLLPRIGQIVHLGSQIYSAGGIGFPLPRLDQIVAEILPHPLSLMQSILPQGLPKTAWRKITPTAGEFNAVGEKNGISLSIMISMHSRPTNNSFLITGTEGTLHIDLFHGYCFLETGSVSRVKKVVRPFDLAIKNSVLSMINLGTRLVSRQYAYPGIWELIGSFYEAVRNGGPSPISPSDVLAVANTRELLLRPN